MNFVGENIMNYSARKTEDFYLSLPITQTAQRIAQEFAAQQPTPEKIEQVRLNTLAVCVVNDYLQMMGIPTDLAKSDSWNPIMRLCVDIADLEVTGYGRLECRVMRSHFASCYIPPEVWEDRIGYVVVQLDDTLKAATVMGFVPTPAAQLPLSQLQPLENLLVHLQQLQQSEVQVEQNKTLVKLSQWLTNIVERDWQTIESLFGTAPSNLAFNFRRSDNSSDFQENTYPENKVRRAKLIDLGLQLAGHAVALIVEIRPESDQKTNILIQVHPTGSRNYLPPLLQLVVLDEAGGIFLEAQARRADNYIQLQFSGNTEERFSVKVALNDVSITEHFVI